jgi:uncharacterized cupin superfamily protein
MTIPLPRGLSLDALSGPREPIAAARLVSGKPETRLAPAFSSTDGRFDVGIWEATEGSWRTTYTENEVGFVISGRLRLTTTSGEAIEFGPGEAFLIPAGWVGEFQILESLRKLYVIYQP